MKLNPKISAIFEEIAKEGANLANIKKGRRASDENNQVAKDIEYYTRLLNMYDNLHSKEERVYLFKSFMEHLHLKSVITDPDNVATIHNVKLKTILFVFILTVIGMITGAILFKTNDGLNSLVETVTNILKILSLVH